MNAIQVFYQSNGEVTKTYYERLTALGPEGELAVALFRALKRSKTPTGFRFRRVSKRKSERIDNAEAFEWAVNQIIRVLALQSQQQNQRDVGISGLTIDKHCNNDIILYPYDNMYPGTSGR